MENKRRRAITGYWLIGLLMVLIGIDICCHVSSSVITEESIVLLFVGILATFVVVGNHVQLMETKEDIKNQVAEMQKEISALRVQLDRKADKFIHIKQKEVTIPADGSAVQVEVESNTDWEISQD